VKFLVAALLLTLNATITRFVWMNPRTWLYFDVAVANGRRLLMGIADKFDWLFCRMND
jgi:hypothetical protein